MLSLLTREMIEIIVATCCFEDACDFARCCTASRSAFLALITMKDAPWPELQQRRDKALKSAQVELDRLLCGSRRYKQLRIFAGAELQRRLRARAANLTPAQAQFVAQDDLALLAAQTPYVEDDGEGDRPEYAGEATLFYGVRLGYGKLTELLYAGRRWYGCSAFSRPERTSQSITDAPHVGEGYGEFRTMEEVARVNELLRNWKQPEGYSGPECLDHDDALDDLLARIGLGVCHRRASRPEVQLRRHAVQSSREAVASFNEYGQLWTNCFAAHAAFHDASITAHANRRGGNADSLICVGYTGYGDGPGLEVVLGIPLGPRMNTSAFDLEQQYGCEFCEDDEAGHCIEQVSSRYLAALLGCEDTSLKARSIRCALHAKMSRVADAIKVDTGVDIAPMLGFHVVTSQGC